MTSVKNFKAKNITEECFAMVGLISPNSEAIKIQIVGRLTEKELSIIIFNSAKEFIDGIPCLFTNQSPFLIARALLTAGKTVARLINLGGGEVYVRVANTMGANVVVTADCASGDDRIATQTLRDGESFAWKFTPNFWGNTLFYCNVRTSNGKSKGWDVYTGNDGSKNWYLRGDGIYIGNEYESNLQKKQNW